MQRNQYNSKNTQSRKTPFCSACKNAGKSEKEYTSHFLRASPDPNSKIVCPVINNAECNYCMKKGHWASEKYCPKMQKDKKNHEKINKQTPNPLHISNPIKKSQNMFAALDSDDEEEQQTTVPIIHQQKTNTWASIAAKPIATKLLLEEEPKSNMVCLSNPPYQPAIPVTAEQHKMRMEKWVRATYEDDTENDEEIYSSDTEVNSDNFSDTYENVWEAELSEMYAWESQPRLY